VGPPAGNGRVRQAGNREQTRSISIE